MSEPTRWDRRLSVAADGKGLIGHAGAVLLRRLADRTGLTAALAAALPAGTGAGWRDRATVIVQLAVAIALGAVNLSDAEQVQAHHQGLFGPAVSDSTTRRTLAAMDDEVMEKPLRVRARVRRHVWSLLHLRPGGFPWETWNPGAPRSDTRRSHPPPAGTNGMNPPPHRTAITAVG